MELLREMINLFSDSQAELFEDYGNLKIIDPRFVKAFKKTFQSGRYNANGQWVMADTHVLSPRAGRNSEITEKDISTAKAIANEFETDQSIIALVVFDKNSGTQYGIVAERNPKTYKQDRTLNIIIDVKALAGKNPNAEQLKAVREYFSDKVKIHSYDMDQIGTASTEFTSGKVYNALNHLNKFLKSPEKKLAVKIIHADEKRPAIKKERIAKRSGMIKVNLSDKEKEDFINQAKASLRSRLDKFKNEKLKNSNDNVDIEKFIDAIKEKGYLDKFLVNGFIYEYWRDNFNFNNMRSGKHKEARYDSDASYVTYKVDDESPEYEKVRNDYWEKAGKLGAELDGDKEAYVREREKLKKRLKLPPTYLKVFFDFEGGKIVPYKMEIEGSS